MVTPKFFLRTLLIFLLISIITFPSKNILAQTADCTIGPKIAGNINVANYATIMEQYSHCSSVYVTIIYTGGDLSNEHYQDTLNNIRTAKSLGIIPIVRTWGQMFGTEAATAAMNLNRMAAEVGSFRVYYGNELNLAWEGCDADPAKCAQSFDDFLSGINYAPKFQLSLPPIAGHQDGEEFKFLEGFLSQKLDNGQTIAQFYQTRGNGMVATIYGSTPQDIENQIDATNVVLAKYGLKVTGISEIGPFVNGGLLQGENQVDQWIEVMTPIFQHFINHPEILKDRGISFLNTSFFADLDEDGYPDVTLLVVVDANGNVQIIKEALILGGGFGWDLIRKYACSINGNVPPSNTYVLRPKPCKNCSLAVPKPVFSCALTPVVVQYQKYNCSDIENCNGKYIAPLDWAPVNFNLNTSETKVPFVGYKDIIRGNASDSAKSRSENENNYLNDYFEGTALFDRREFDMAKPQDSADMYWEYGVFRKLAPNQIQDNYRKNMVSRSLAPGGPNYKVEGTVYDIDSDNRRSKPQMVTKYIKDWAKPKICPFEGDLNSCKMPPEKPDYKTCKDQACVYQQDQNYQDYLAQWRKTEWGQLWNRIPLFSREDAPGKVILTVEHDPGTINAAKSSSKEEIPLSIPHLTRLYESTNALYKLLIPTMQQQKTAYLPQSNNQASLNPQTTPVLLAQAAISDSTEPKLLAQTNPTQNPSCSGMNLIIENKGDSFAVKGWNTQPSSCGDPSDYGFQLNYLIDGKIVSSCGSPMVSGYLPHYNPNGTDTERWGLSISDLMGGQCNVPITPTELGNRHLTVQFNITNSHASDQGGCTKTPSCNCVAGDPACAGKPQPPPDPCSNHTNINASCNPQNPVTDQKPNDAICCSSKAVINVIDYKEPVSQTTYNKLCNNQNCYLVDDTEAISRATEQGIRLNPIPQIQKCDPPIETAKMTRKVSVKLDIPYLRDVYEKTAGPGMSLFNMFKPSSKKNFPDNSAKSNITYNVSSSEPFTFIGLGADINLSDPNNAETKKYLDSIKQKSFTGELYFPYLGGIQQTKKCVSEQLLIPKGKLCQTYQKDAIMPNGKSCKQDKGCDICRPNQCSFWGGSLNQTSPAQATTCTDLPKVIAYRSAAPVNKDRIKANGLTGIKNNGYWSTQSYLDSFDKVYNNAVVNGWNPAWLIALWIEESGASSVTAWDLGCRYDSDGTQLPTNNLDLQLACLNKKIALYPTDYLQFMLTYSDGTQSGRQGEITAGTRPADALNKFCTNPNFPGALTDWYDMLTQ